MSTETNASAGANQGAEAHSDKNSAGVSYTNTVEAGASVTTGNDNASVTAGVSVKTGTEASAEAGLVTMFMLKHLIQIQLKHMQQLKDK